MIDLLDKQSTFPHIFHNVVFNYFAIISYFGCTTYYERNNNKVTFVRQMSQISHITVTELPQNADFNSKFSIIHPVKHSILFKICLLSQSK